MFCDVFLDDFFDHLILIGVELPLELCDFRFQGGTDTGESEFDADCHCVVLLCVIALFLLTRLMEIVK